MTGLMIYPTELFKNHFPGDADLSFVATYILKHGRRCSTETKPPVTPEANQQRTLSGYAQV
jgi:hypothetical protein